MHLAIKYNHPIPTKYLLKVKNVKKKNINKKIISRNKNILKLKPRIVTQFGLKENKSG